MAQKNKGLLVFGSIVVIGAIGYYLWSKSKKSKGAGSSQPTPSDKPILMDEKIGGKDSPKPLPPVKAKPKPTITTPTELDTTEKVKNFQDWLDTNYPKWLNGKTLNKKGGYGTYGPSTQSAWSTYGTKYKEALKVADTQSKFKIGQFVTAKNTFNARGIILRTNGWSTVDGSGISLPERQYRAGADLGKVKVILVSGRVVVTVPKEIGPSYGTRIYTDILVRPSDIE